MSVIEKDKLTLVASAWEDRRKNLEAMAKCAPNRTTRQRLDAASGELWKCERALKSLIEDSGGENSNERSVSNDPAKGADSPSESLSEGGRE